MPSRDRIDPQANAWMDPAVAPARLREITKGRQMSAFVMRLARRLGRDPDELASRMPPDTLRRTKYPVIERVNDDGSRTFEHDAGI